MAFGDSRVEFDSISAVSETTVPSKRTSCGIACASPAKLSEPACKDNGPELLDMVDKSH